MGYVKAYCIALFTILKGLGVFFLVTYPFFGDVLFGILIYSAFVSALAGPMGVGMGLIRAK